MNILFFILFFCYQILCNATPFNSTYDGEELLFSFLESHRDKDYVEVIKFGEFYEKLNEPSRLSLMRLIHEIYNLKDYKVTRGTLGDKIYDFISADRGRMYNYLILIEHSIVHNAALELIVSKVDKVDELYSIGNAPINYAKDYIDLNSGPIARYMNPRKEEIAKRLTLKRLSAPVSLIIPKKSLIETSRNYKPKLIPIAPKKNTNFHTHIVSKKISKPKVVTQKIHVQNMKVIEKVINSNPNLSGPYSVPKPHNLEPKDNVLSSCFKVNESKYKKVHLKLEGRGLSWLVNYFEDNANPVTSKIKKEHVVDEVFFSKINISKYQSKIKCALVKAQLYTMTAYPGLDTDSYRMGFFTNKKLYNKVNLDRGVNIEVEHLYFINDKEINGKDEYASFYVAYSFNAPNDLKKINSSDTFAFMYEDDASVAAFDLLLLVDNY